MNINKGGYALIDCKGLNMLAESKQTITGLYEQVKVAMLANKPMVACNCKWGTKPITPIDVFAIDWIDYIICTSSTLQVIIDKQDGVVIQNMAPTQN